MFETEKYHFGIKKLNERSFLLPEEWFYSISHREFLEPINQPQLIDVVPEEIKKLFEVARGAIAYGYFFYPLLSLGSEQLFRVLDTATSIKCSELGAPQGVSNFARQFEWLKAQNIISSEHDDLWFAYKELRNSTSHPKYQQILSYPQVLKLINSIVRTVNDLFSQC